MAQVGFTLSDEGRAFTVLNDSGTTAITSGDLVYSATNDDVVTGTAARVRSAYAAGDVKVKTIKCSDGGRTTVIGVALEDIPADGYGAAALEGIFMHPAQANIEAGNMVKAMTGNGTTVVVTSKLNALSVATTTVTKAIFDETLYKIGKALTGGSADGKYIIWKLTL